MRRGIAKSTSRRVDEGTRFSAVLCQKRFNQRTSPSRSGQKIYISYRQDLNRSYLISPRTKKRRHILWNEQRANLLFGKGCAEKKVVFKLRKILKQRFCAYERLRMRPYDYYQSTVGTLLFQEDNVYAQRAHGRL